jgi:uncharacterized membrane protein YbhN (UPF0104 family)
VRDGRFAPSPTGPLHLGSLRTALIAWLFARSQHARFLVRIEDLDPQRSRREFERAQLEDLAALGIDWDGSVVRQSEHRSRAVRLARGARHALGVRRRSSQEHGGGKSVSGARAVAPRAVPASPRRLPTEPVGDVLSPRRLRRRLIELAIVVAVVVVVVVAGPGLGSLRHHLAHANTPWIVAAVGFEVLSTLSYVVVFRYVFCRRMAWRHSYQIGMSEQGANSMLSVSGAGGLALGVWALKRGGMSTEHIARRTVAFFFLTSLPNVAGVALLALLYLVGVLPHDRDSILTYGFGLAALGGIVLAVALPTLLGGNSTSVAPDEPRGGRIHRALRFARYSLAQGLRDARVLLVQRPLGVLGGATATMVFDMAVLGVAFRAFGYSPSLGVLALGYLIGQLGGNIPVPGGIGGIDAGLIGTFALYHQPLAVTTAAVLVYHTISLWVPALLGSGAFLQLRRTLAREERPAALCEPLSEPIGPLPHERLAS